MQSVTPTILNKNTLKYVKLVDKIYNLPIGKLIEFSREIYRQDKNKFLFC